MIIYMYLTIIIIFSILTGIITTIIEKKSLHKDTSCHIVKNVDVPKKVVRVTKKDQSNSIPVISLNQNISHTVQINVPQGISNSSVVQSYSEPVILGVVDDEII